MLNFGVSGFGVGQFMLTYETYARAYQPDVVFVLLSGFHMARTISPVTGGVGQPGKLPLSIRPSYMLEGDQLTITPPVDYDTFLETQQEAIETLCGPDRIWQIPYLSTEPDYRFVEHPVEWVIHHSYLWKTLRVRVYNLRDRWFNPERLEGDREVIMAGGQPTQLEEETLALNYALLERLNEQVAGDGGQLVIVDASLYFNPNDNELANRNLAFATENDIGYIPLHDGLNATGNGGRDAQWRCDGHFSALGNEVFAQEVKVWLDEHPVED